MGIDKQSDLATNLQIGPTSLGMVRIYVEGEGVDLPLDFEPEEAEEIANELWPQQKRHANCQRQQVKNAKLPTNCKAQ